MRKTLLRLAPPAAVKAITSGEVQLQIKDSARFDYMRIVVGTLSPWFGRMEWEVFAEDGASFITTDSPVTLQPVCPTTRRGRDRACRNNGFLSPQLAARACDAPSRIQRGIRYVTVGTASYA